jgi:hypothetical protein
MTAEFYHPRWYEGFALNIKKNYSMDFCKALPNQKSDSEVT